MKTKITHLFIMLMAVFMLPSIVSGQITTFPWTEGFENGGTIPTGWTNDALDAGGDWAFVTSNSNGATSDNTTGSGYYALLNDYSIRSYDSPFNLLSPTFDLSTAGKTYQLSYWVWIGSSAATNPIKVYLSSDGGTTWNLEKTHDKSITGSWVQNTIVLGSYTTATVAIKLEGTSIWGSGTDNSGIDDIVVEEAPNCLTPTNQTVTTITATSAKLNWTTGGATNFGIEYGPKDFTQGTGTYMAVTTNEFLPLTGLTANTEYDWYVKDSCSAAEVSDWAGPNTFTTMPPAHSFPLTEDFESGLTKFDNASGNDEDFIIETTIVHSGVQSIHNEYSGSNTNILHETGVLDLSSSSYPALEFWQIAKTEGGYDKCYIEVSTDGGASYNAIDDSLYSGTTDNYAVKGYFHEDSYSDWGTSTESPDNSWWKKEKFDLTPFKLSNIRFRFKITSDFSGNRDGWYIDDIAVKEQPVNEVEIVDIIGIQGGIGQGNYTVKAIVKNNGVNTQTLIPLNYITEGGIVNSEVMNSIAALTTDTFTFSNKVSSSALADAIMLSVYSTLPNDEDLTNDTAYGEVINLALPYEDGFENYANNSTPDFWTVLNNTGSTSAYAKVYNSSSSTYTHSGSYNFHMYNTSITGNDKSIIAALPAVNTGLSTLRMEFWLKGEASDIIIGVMTDPNDSSTFVGVDTLLLPPASYNEYAVMFDSYLGSGKYIAFKHGMNATYNDFYIDDIKLFTPPTNDIIVTSIIGDYASFDQGNHTIKAIIKNNGTNPQTNIPLNFLIEGGTVVSEIMPSIAAFTTDTFTFTATVSNSATPDTLMLSVYSTLSNDEDLTNDTTYGEVINLALPYEDGFENYANNSTPDYWTILNNTGSTSAYAKVYNSSYSSHTGSYNFHMYNDSKTGNDKSLIAVLPAVNTPISTLKMEFWLKGEASDLIIGVMTDPNDSSTFEGVDTLLLPAASYNKYLVYFNTYSGNGKYIAFKHGLNTTYDDFYIDEVSLMLTPINEIEIAEIIKEYGGLDVQANDTILVIVKNNGLAAQTAIPINYKLDNETVVTESIASLDALATDTFEFVTKFDATLVGQHTITVYTSLATDEDTSNDTLSTTFITHGNHTIPYTEDFEAGLTYFYNDENNDRNFNIIDNLSHSGTQSIYNSYSTNNTNILLEAGTMDLTSSTTPVFDFWHIAKTEAGYDKSFIEISTDNGTTWTAIDDSLYIGETSQYASKGYFDEDSYSDWGSGSGTPDNSQWKMERFNLEPFKDDSIKLRFRFYSDSYTQSNGWYIDDITVQEEPDAIANLGNDTTLCDGSDIDLFAGCIGYQYLWTANGDTVTNITNTINTDSAGIYTVEVIGIASVAYDTIIVTGVDLPTANFTTNEICIGDDATLNANFTGASPWNFSYTKIGVDTTDLTGVTSPWTSSFALPDTASFTIITITDANACVSASHFDTAIVNVNPLPMVAISSLPNVCANENVFTYTQGSGAAGGSGYYTGLGVDSAASTFNAVTAGAGSHTITYTYIDSNSCANSASEIQLVNALPNITAVATDNPVPYNATTTLTATVSNAVGTISYTWTPSSNITEADTTTAAVTTTNALSTVNYYVTAVDDGNSCSTMETIILPYSGGPVSVAPSSNPIAICSGDAAILSSGTSGGSGTVNYVWTSNPAGFNSTDESPSASPTVDTWFIVAATDDVLTTTDSVLVTIIPDPIISYAVDTTYACLGSDANAIVNITGAAPFSYTYNGIITNATDNIDTIMITAGVDATYQLTSVTDNNGCNSTGAFDSLVVRAWELPTITASDNDTMCYGDSVLVSLDFTGSAPWNFDVNDGNMVNSVSNTPSPFTAYTGPDLTTMYTVVSLTDGNGCMSTGNLDSITILVNQLPTATVSDYDTLCFGDSVQLAVNFNGVAPYNFNVNIEANPLSLTSSTDAFAIYVAPTTTTNFILTTITDGNGCITNNLTDTTEVYVNSLPAVPSFSGLAADYCEDAAVVTLSGLPTGGVFSGNGITSSDFDPSSANIGSNAIEYRVSDANGCENFVINATVINALPTISIMGLAPDYCIDAADVTLTATPTGTGGAWSGSATSTGDFSPTTQGVGTHTIFYTFTDGNACVNNDSVTTMVNALPVVTVTTLADVCADANNFMITGGMPSGGDWSGNGVSSNYFNATNAGAGSHYLTYTFTDANGCVNMDSTMQLVNPLPVLNITGFDADYCANASTDTLDATPAGGTFFGMGMTANVFDPSVVNAGSVSILYMYTDANGCFNSTPATTTVNSIPMVDLGSDKTVCEYSSSMLDAGNAGDTYIWNTGATSQSIVLDTNGFGIGDFMYNVTVTNANSCSNMDSVEITYEATPVSQLTDTNTICGEDANITLDAGYISGNTYVWSNGVSWSSITVSSTDLGGTMGNMSVEITSDGGCVFNDTTFVYFREIPAVDLGGDEIVCVNHEFTIDAGAGFASYLWNTGATTQTITIDSNTFDVGHNLIKVEVYNDANCNAMDSMILVVDPCTGIKMPELSNANINIYPNPSTGLFQIDVDGLENEEYNLDIYNSVGAVVYSDKVSNNGNSKQTWKLDFSTYAKGVYYVRLHSNGDIKVKRIVIQ